MVVYESLYYYSINFNILVGGLIFLLVIHFFIGNLHLCRSLYYLFIVKVTATTIFHFIILYVYTSLSMGWRMYT